jgi:hypothetical protein
VARGRPRRRLLAAEDGHLWKVLRIPAEADHDPEKGETDPLGREPGEFLESARGRTVEQWQAIKTRVGSRTWQSLYQGRPTAAEGNMFKRDHWREYDGAAVDRARRRPTHRDRLRRHADPGT